MPFRPSLHHQRRFCGLMLLLWLCAVLSGTVNACVLAENAQNNHHEHAEHAMPHEGMVESGHLHADESDHHQVDAHIACHKFCQDEARTLPPSKHLDGVDFTPVLLLYGGPLLPEATTSLAVAQAPQRPQAHGPPLVIRFLRLTL